MLLRNEFRRPWRQKTEAAGQLKQLGRRRRRIPAETEKLRETERTAGVARNIIIMLWKKTMMMGKTWDSFIHCFTRFDLIDFDDGLLF